MSLFVETSPVSERCSSAEETLRYHGRTFHLASRVLPGPIRARAASLYAFCRHVDDLADTEQDRDRAARELIRLRNDLARRSARCVHGAQFLSLANDTDLPIEPALILIDTVSEELQGRRVATQGELIDYAYGVAGTVGLMMCTILGARERDAVPHAVDLGIAMQLTNVARDVGEDAGMGRIYLPATWLGAMTPAQVLSPDPAGQEELRQATARCLELADSHYRSGLAGLKFLPARCRYSIAVAAQVYRAIGDRVADAGYRSWDRRAVVAAPARLRIAASTLLRQLPGIPSGIDPVHPTRQRERASRPSAPANTESTTCHTPRTTTY